MSGLGDPLLLLVVEEGVDLLNIDVEIVLAEAGLGFLLLVDRGRGIMGCGWRAVERSISIH